MLTKFACDWQSHQLMAFHASVPEYQTDCELCFFSPWSLRTLSEVVDSEGIASRRCSQGLERALESFSRCYMPRLTSSSASAKSVCMYVCMYVCR